MEADYATRNTFLPFLNSFGIIFLSWYDTTDMGNLEWVNKTAKAEWKDYDIKVWRHVAKSDIETVRQKAKAAKQSGSSEHYATYLVAVRRDTGFTVKCAAAVRCTDRTLMLQSK